MSQETQKTDTRSAAQKVSDLEQMVGYHHSVLDNLSKDLNVLKNAVKLLDNKVRAIVQASNAGETLTDDVLDRLMIENNIEELKNKVTTLVNNGILVPESQVSENSFIVGKEVDETGTVVNPRIQFTLKALAVELQTKLVGAKPGDSVALQEGKLPFTVLESYSIQEPVAATPDSTTTASSDDSSTSTDSSSTADLETDSTSTDSSSTADL